MTKLASYLGAAGLALLAAGSFLRFAQPARDLLWASFLVAGLVLLVLFLVNDWPRVSRFLGRRSAKEGANALLLSLAVVGVLVAINYVASRHARQWDLTASRQYTLSDQTTRILSDLETDVAILLLDNPASPGAREARDLLDLYGNASDRVEIAVIDPEAEPEKALSYQEPGAPGLTLGTVLVEASGRRQRATAATEPEITNALLRALREETKKIYFTGGHQEKSIDESDPNSGISMIREKLQGSTYESETLVIARTMQAGSGEEQLSIPDDAAAVVVAGPRMDFLPEELQAIDRYLDAGGKAIFLVDPSTQARTESLTAYLREKGAELRDDVVVDPLSLPPVYPVVRSYGRHPIVESFSNVLSVFPLVRSVVPAEELPEGVEVRELFSSEPESWSETRLDELSSRQGPAPDQERGPLTLSVAVTIPLEPAAADGEADGAGERPAAPPPSARLVVVGDSDFISNELASAPVLNADLFLNMVNWAVQDEELISIRPRQPEDRRIFLSPQQMTTVLLLSLVVIPGIVLITGISVWWGRR